MPAKDENGTQLKSYSQEEIELGLRATALCGGIAEHAAEMLKSEGIVISPSVMRSWVVQRFPRRYAEIQAEIQDDIAARVAAQSMDIAQRAAQLESDVVARLEDPEVMDKIAPRDLARTLHSLSQSKGVNIEKAALLRGQPTEIHEIRNKDLLDELRLLKKMGVIEGTVLDEEDVPQLEEASS